jgi:hypothetical protein
MRGKKNIESLLPSPHIGSILPWKVRMKDERLIQEEKLE